MTETLDMEKMAIEWWDVIQWRLDELMRAGWPIVSALRLAEDQTVDLHQACELLERGCPAHEALRILL